jgi:RNA polymerase sigma-70 factor (ECF subfamily)
MENAQPSVPAPDDASLVLRAKAGHADAFEMLAARHVRVVLGLIRQNTHDEHAAQDAAQEALLSAYLHLSQLEDPRKFSAWLYRIAVRHARRMPTRPVAPGATGRDAPVSREALVQEERRRAVRAAVGELDEPYRLVVTLRYLEGLDATEIAGRLGVSHGTVRSWLSRIRPILREKLSRHLDG